ncbi:MAG: hypothetical protein AAF581_00515 [Planctomycetota bacterium]
MRRSVLLPLLLLTCLAVPFGAFGQQDLTIGTGSVSGLMSTTVDVTMTTTAPTQGFVLAVGYDTSKISITSFDPSAAVLAAPAELVASSNFDATGGATLGVVLDSNSPFAGQTLAAGTTVIAHLNIMPDLVVAAPETVALTLTDGTFGSPTLDNIIVQGGLSLGAGSIDLNDGSVDLEVPPPDSLTIVGGDISVGETACAQIVLDNMSGDVQGIVLAIEHDPGLILKSINTGAATAGAEFVVDTILNGSNGGTLGIVMDFNPPFLGQTIPMGSGNHVADFCYCCVSHPVDDGDPLTDDATTHSLTFVDGVLGSPPLDNVIVLVGLSLGTIQNNGEMRCLPAPLEDTCFSCGALDSEGNLETNCLQGEPGETVEVCFFWKDATDNVAAFQLGICWDNTTDFSVCNDPCFDISGTILEAVGAEFVNCSVDNANGDMIVGILLDFLPPFDRQTVPPTADWLKIGSVSFCLDPATPCGSQNNITFCDTADGLGNVPTHNLVTVWREVPEGSGNYILTDVQGFPTVGCCIEVNPERRFVRGNCNNDPQNKVTITDAATVLAVQFQGVPVGCLDACDVNDDGKINLADAVYLLNYLFKSGPPHNSPAPPSPFPTQGTDTTVDDPSGFHAELDCVDGRDPCAGP